MLVVLSPAKTLDFESPLPSVPVRHPRLLTQSAELIDHCRQLDHQQLMALMKISQPLAELNVVRFANWHPEHHDELGRPAILAFKGDVYQGLAADRLTPDQLTSADQHIRILSGLYGLLRPLDLILPHRLEMGTSFKNPRGKNLYQFWDDRITDLLRHDLAQHDHDVLINLASEEYFKSVNTRKLSSRIITPVFLDEKNGQFKVISFYAKTARGLMARYFIEQQPQQVEDLQGFNVAGYAFDQQLSSRDQWVFKRAQMPSPLPQPA